MVRDGRFHFYSFQCGSTSTFFRSASSFLMSGGHARLKPLPGSFFVASILTMIDFHIFSLRIKLSGKVVSSVPESARQTTRPSDNTRTILPLIEPRRVLTLSPGLKSAAHAESIAIHGVCREACGWKRPPRCSRGCLPAATPQATVLAKRGYDHQPNHAAQ